MAVEFEVNAPYQFKEAMDKIPISPMHSSAGIRLYLIFLIASISSQAFAGHATDVSTVCAGTGHPVVSLYFRNRAKNVEVIGSTLKQKSDDLIRFVLDANHLSKNEMDRDRKAEAGVIRFVPNGPARRRFLSYNSNKQKLEDPKGYRLNLLRSIDEFLPKSLNKTGWFLGLSKQNALVRSTTFRSASNNETGEFYGAIMRGTATQGLHDLEIIYSNNSSEPFPYLIPLIAHEIHHAESYFEKIKLERREDIARFQVVDEAKAMSLQIEAYVALARKNPKLFCNWMYSSWLYGDIVIPLSWSMASLEQSLRDGSFLFHYVTNGNLKDESNLLNSSRTDLSTELRSEIHSLKLRYSK